MNPISWTFLFTLFALAFIAPCSSGCALGPAQLQPQAKSALDAAIVGWRESGHRDCPAMSLIGVAYAWAPCGNRDAVGCVEMRGRRQTIVIRDGQPILDELGGIVVHEEIHIGQRCEGVIDEAHQDGSAWIESGGDSSAQGRARDILLRPLVLTETLK